MSLTCRSPKRLSRETLGACFHTNERGEVPPHDRAPNTAGLTAGTQRRELSLWGCPVFCDVKSLVRKLRVGWRDSQP